jgi:hypothetical protein
MRKSICDGPKTLTNCERLNIKPTTGNLIPESSFCLLKRYMVLTNYAGSLQTWTIDRHGKVANAIYAVSAFIPLMIHDRSVNVKCIVRVFLGKNLNNPFSVAYFLKSGHLVREIWHDLPYFFDIEPKMLDMYITLQGEAGQSDELLVTDKSTQGNEAYLQEHPELKLMLKSYVQSAGRNQPTDLLTFSMEYFKKLADKFR